MTDKKPRKNPPKANRAWQASFTERMKEKGYVRYYGWATPENKVRLKEHIKMLEKKYPPLSS